MTNEQWLVYLWSIYPNGEFIQIWTTLFVTCIVGIFFIGIIHHEGENDETTMWSKLGKWKIVIPSILAIFIFISYLVPKRNHFLYIVATPYVVESGKSIIESLQDSNSKLSKLNQMTDKALDKALKYLDENKQSEPEVKK